MVAAVTGDFDFEGLPHIYGWLHYITPVGLLFPGSTDLRWSVTVFTRRPLPLGRYGLRWDCNTLPLLGPSYGLRIAFYVTVAVDFILLPVVTVLPDLVVG